MDMQADSPPWLGSGEGISHQVLPPWTPVTLTRTAQGQLHVGVWGRTYVYGPSPAPLQIVSMGAELFAGPARINLRLADGPVEWQPDPPSVLSATSEKVVLQHLIRSGSLRLRARTEIQYDGLAVVTWDLSARDEVTIESLSVGLPIRAEHARYFYHYPGRWGDVENVGQQPATGFFEDFRPFLWVGDEERGLCGFCEHDRNLVPSLEQPGPDFSQGGDVIVVHSRLVERPLTLGTYSRAALRYMLGFQATPVKPPEKDAWEYRTVHAGNYGMETLPTDEPATLTYQAERNIDFAHGTLEFWARPLPRGDAPDPDQTVVTIAAGNGKRASIGWTHGGTRLLLTVGDLTAEGEMPPLPTDRFTHFALLWPDPIGVCVNGEPVAELPGESLVDGSPAGGSIVFGAAGGHIVVDEIVISAAAYSAEELREAVLRKRAPEKDPHILLVDHLDQPFAPGAIEYLDARRAGLPGTSPTIGRGQGIIGRRGTCTFARFRRGKSGTALQLGLHLAPLEMLARLGVRTLCFHGHWTDIHSYTRTEQAEQLRSLVKACHERDIQLLLYFGCLLSSLAPEYEPWAAEWLAMPRRGYREHCHHPLPLQDIYIACPASPWQDFVVQGIADLMDEFDIDGVYLDGIANPPECYNLRHGCGHIGDDGLAHPSYPFLEARRMIRRIHTVVKQRKPDGQVNIHQSACMAIPSLGWATSYWDGEQFTGISPDTFPLDALPLDTFRAEFMGHQWGVPAELLCYEQPFTFRQACAVSLLHDVPVRANGLGPSLRQNSKLWRLMDRFGRKQARWLPYWRNSAYVSVEPDDVFCSIYIHPRNGVLFVVSNLSRASAHVRLRLNLQALGLSDETTVKHALSGKDLSQVEGNIAFDLPSLDWRILWASPTA